MKPAVIELLSAQTIATFNARGDTGHETEYWRLAATSPGTSVTIAVQFQPDSDSDVLASRVVEQEVLDLLDEPTSR